MSKKITCAIIGCGRIANKHFEAIEKHKTSLNLLAVCDNNVDIANKYAKKYNCDAYQSLSDLLKNCKAELIILCTPSGIHTSQTILCAKENRHVMTEKPMATRWQDGLEMVKACDKAGVQLFVVKQNRRNTTLQLLKHAIEKKRFGKIYMVQVNVFWTRPQEYYDQAQWRGTWEFDGGALMNQASHYIDLLDWLIGPVKSVQSMIATLARDIEVEDTAVMNIKWRSGALGSVSVTMLTYPENLEGSITIIGEKGTVKVGGVAVNEIELWKFADNHPDDKKIKQASYETSSVYGFGHPLYYKNVIDTLRGKAKAETDGREGLKSLELLIASYLSARDGKKVSLPLEY